MKKIICVALSCVFMLSLTPAFALETNSYDSILLEMGIPEEIIEVIPEADAKDLVEAYLKNSESVEVSTSTLEVDVLSEMKEFVNKTDSELLLKGYSQDQIDKGRDIIETYNKTSDEELLNSGLSECEVDSLRDALDSSKNEMISPMAAISPTKLTFTQTSTDYSSSSRADYFIGIYFNWNSPYVWTIYNDKIAVSWGGNLKQVKVHQNVNYYNTNLTNTAFTESVGVAIPTYSEKAVNAMGIYEFPQGYSKVVAGSSGQAKFGSIRYEIYQTQFSGNVSKAIAYYCHQVTTYNASINFSGTGVTPAISIGTAYDTIYAESNIRY